MSSYSRLLSLFIIGLACSCNPAKMVVDFNESRIDTSFLSTVYPEADSIIIYKTSFREKYVNDENTGVLEFANLGDQEKGRAFKYLNVRGDSQDIYLIRFMKKTSSKFIYLSAKYANFPGEDGLPVTHCKGFGPAYAGSYDPFFKVINLPKALRIDRGGDIHYKSGKSPKPVFILTEPLTKASHDPVRVKEIMFGEYNKYGGKRPVVMPVAGIFNGKIEYLQFDYVKTINSD